MLIAIMMMFGDHSFVAFVDNDDIGAVFVMYFLKGEGGCVCLDMIWQSAIILCDHLDYLSISLTALSDPFL